MPEQPHTSDYKWINTLLLIAAILAAVTAIAAFLHDRGRHVDHHAGLISDISVNLGGRIVREHCTTCHPKGASARPSNLSSGPAVHPDIDPHSWEMLGCTGCHLGEGMALDVTISHGLPGLGGRRVLAGGDLQGSCYRCHELAPLAGAERAWQGYELFLTNACDSCHRVAGLEQGGWYGPDLTIIGSLLGIEELLESIREPRKDPINSIMPRFPLSAREARDIAYFLKSRVQDPFFTTPMQVQAGRVRLPSIEIMPGEDELSPEGRLLAARKCLACHKFQGTDGLVAPDLTYTGALREAEFLRDFLTNPPSLIPGAVMPNARLSPAEEEQIIRFLTQQALGPPRLHEDIEEEDLDEELESPDPAHEAHRLAETTARHLYMALCQRCHAAAGDGFGLIQPNLANFPRAFSGNAEFFRRRSDDHLVRSVEKGLPGTSMPPYRRLLTKDEIENLIDLIFTAFIGIPRHEKTPLPTIPEASFARLTEKRVDRLYERNCLTCHGIAGTGRGPQYLRHLPRPRNLTNHHYFAYLTDEEIGRAISYGIPGTAMPPFAHRLSAPEVWALVDRIRTLSGGFHDQAD